MVQVETNKWHCDRTTTWQVEDENALVAQSVEYSVVEVELQVRPVAHVHFTSSTIDIIRVIAGVYPH